MPYFPLSQDWQLPKTWLLSMPVWVDALLATVQMPSGIPVATVALNGAKNAAWLAAEILALSDDTLAGKLEAERVSMAQQIAAKEEKLQNELNEL